MLTIRPAAQRGHSNHGWLLSYHTFSFSDYHEPEHMGFRTLRVINEDRVAPGEGFPPHHHRDMEIVSYVLAGALEHRDSMGNGSVIRPGDVQRMSAGTGVQHSEYNASKTEPVHFLQIWILPEQSRIQPGYEQKHFAAEERRGRWRLIVAPDGAEGSVRAHQDARLYASLLGAGQELGHRFEPGRAGWLQVARGSVRMGEHELRPGDGVAITGQPDLTLTGLRDAELLLFDLK
ncbi:MAG TPA: pirin family protein [Polyangia bacterium]|nr:pirin family protein [Polyangia bacterium]